MSEEQLDTSQSEASSETPSSTGTQSSEQVATTASDSAPSGTPEPRKYAGKYDSADALENAYTNLQSKIGNKTFSEKLGDKILSATGYTVDELTKAGYTEDQIAEQLLNNTQQKEQPSAKIDSKTVIKETVENAKVNQALFDVDLMKLYRKNPEAEQFEDWIHKFKAIPENRNKSAAEIFEDLKPLIDKGEETAHEKQSVKERAGMKISNSPVPKSKAYDNAVSRYKKSGHLDDATALVRESLFGKKN